jgi:hypothetical protein
MRRKGFTRDDVRLDAFRVQCPQFRFAVTGTLPQAAHERHNTNARSGSEASKRGGGLPCCLWVAGTSTSSEAREAREKKQSEMEMIPLPSRCAHSRAVL